MVDGLLAKLGIGTVLPICSSLFATGLPVLSRTGFPRFLALELLLWHFDLWREEVLDEVSVMNRLLHVDCQKRFLVSQTNSMYQIAGFGRGST